MFDFGEDRVQESTLLSSMVEEHAFRSQIYLCVVLISWELLSFRIDIIVIVSSYEILLNA